VFFPRKSHNFILPSELAEASKEGLSFLAKYKPLISDLCACKFDFILDVSKSQEIIEPPFEPEKKNFSSSFSNKQLAFDGIPVNV